MKAKEAGNNTTPLLGGEHELVEKLEDAKHDVKEAINKPKRTGKKLWGKFRSKSKVIGKVLAVSKWA